MEGTRRRRDRSRGDGGRPRIGLEDPGSESSREAAWRSGESRTSPEWEIPTCVGASSLPVDGVTILPPRPDSGG